MFKHLSILAVIVFSLSAGATVEAQQNGERGGDRTARSAQVRQPGQNARLQREYQTGRTWNAQGRNQAQREYTLGRAQQTRGERR